MHRSLEAMPQPCHGLLAGHGCHIEAAMLLASGTVMKPSDAQAAAANISRQGMSIVGWFHSRTDAHEPDTTLMQSLERLSTSLPELTPTCAVPIHLLVALDMKGRLDLHAYIHNHDNLLIRAPLHLTDDTPLYLGSPRR